MHFPPILVLGATGRIGGLLRKTWPEAAARWQTRRGVPGPGWVRCDPLADPGGLASSAAVYGAQAGLLAETAPPAPLSDYARIKIGMEQQGAELGQSLDVPVCALRIGNIAGVDAILGGWRVGFRLDRFEDGTTPRRSYIGVKTLARTLLALSRCRDLPPVLNVAAPGVTEMGALLDAAGLDWTRSPRHQARLRRWRWMSPPCTAASLLRPRPVCRTSLWLNGARWSRYDLA